MFVKIKLEPGSGKPNIFSLDDNATIHDLKIKMESIIDIPADCQEIHTLSTSLANGVVLASMVQQNNVTLNDSGLGINGAAISLYSNQKFICFLQFYNEIEGDIQGNFFDQAGDETRKLLPIDQVPQYYETVDTEDSCTSSSSSSRYSGDSDSSDSVEGTGSEAENESSRVSVMRKRKSTDAAKTSKRICAGLTEETKPQSQTTTLSECPKKASPAKCSKDSASTPPPPSPKCSKDSASPPPPPKCSRNSASPLPSPNCSKDSASPSQTPPYAYVCPEQRQFMLAISSDSPNNDFSGLLCHFYDLFESSQNCTHFQFSEKHSVAKFDNKLWLTCANKDTYEWINRSLSPLNGYKSSTLFEDFHLVECSFILPKVVQNKALASVLQLMEIQNSGLHTDKWCVVEQKTLLATSEDYSQRAITHICDNEEVKLWIDPESVDLLRKKEFKLKYCFWTLLFLVHC